MLDSGARDLIVLGDGNVSIIGAAGDTILGGNGSSTSLDGRAGNQSIIGGSGDSETIWSGAGDTIVGASANNSFIDGSAGRQTIIGGSSGNETLAGSTGGRAFTFGLADQVRPVPPPIVNTIPPFPAPSPPDLVTAELDRIYRDLLARNPDASGIATYTAMLAQGASVAEIRQIVAHSPETRNDLNMLYHQVFDRNIDTSGLKAYTDALGAGWTLNEVQ